MHKLASIGGLLKKIYRLYSNELLKHLQSKGFTDLRPSFLEVLFYICESDGPSIKQIGASCGLKKQTMTSHLNELEKRNYIVRNTSLKDKREQRIYLTEYGEKFKFNLFECIDELESTYGQVVGQLELDRIDHLLKNFHQKIDKRGELPLNL
jgi:DNA-binding MarR family transcriptional regulator